MLSYTDPPMYRAVSGIFCPASSTFNWSCMAFLLKSIPPVPDW